MRLNALQKRRLALVGRGAAFSCFGGLWRPIVGYCMNRLLGLVTVVGVPCRLLIYKLNVNLYTE